MIPGVQRPISLAEASRALEAHSGEAAIVAGGTALVLMIRQRLLDPSVLVSLDGVRDRCYREVETVEGDFRIGGGETLARVAAHPAVRTQLPALATACQVVGNVRIRNRATLAGNLAEADYASDPPSALVALDARCSAVSTTGSRTIRVSELHLGYYETATEPNEVLADITVPLPEPGTGSAYVKFTSRSSEDRPCVGVAAMLGIAGGRVTMMRVAVGAVAPVPQFLPEVCAAAVGEPVGESLFARVAADYARRITPLDDDRGTAWYRRRMIEVHVRRALWEAAAHAVGGSAGGGER